MKTVALLSALVLACAPLSADASAYRAPRPDCTQTIFKAQAVVESLDAAVAPDAAEIASTKATTFRAVSDTGSAILYDDRHVVGKWLCGLPVQSTTGVGGEFTAQGGYAFLAFDLSR